MTYLVFACGLSAGIILDLFLLRTLLAPPFRIWPTPKPGSWQSLPFWGLFRGGMVATFLVTGGLYRFSRNPQYTASIIGLIGLSIGANSILTIIMSVVMSGAYVMMALVEEDWLKQLYGAPYRDYCRETSRFLDIQGLLALLDRKKPSRQAG